MFASLFQVVCFCSGRVDGCDESPEICFASSPQSSKKSTNYPSRIRLLPVLRNSPHRLRVNTLTSVSPHGQLPVKCSAIRMKPACPLNPLHASKCCSINANNVMRTKDEDGSCTQGTVFSEVPVMRRTTRARRNLNPLDTAETGVENLRNSSIPNCEESINPCSSTAGRISPEIPVMGRITRSPKKSNPLNQAKTDVKNSSIVTIPGCEESRIH